MDSKNQELRRDDMQYETAKPGSTPHKVGLAGAAFRLSDAVVNDTAEHVEARIRTLEIEGGICRQASATWGQKADEAFARAGEIRDLFRKVSRA